MVEQPGRVAVLRGGTAAPSPSSTSAAEVGYDGAERGLLSIAFPPDYRRSGSFYVYYNDQRRQHPRSTNSSAAARPGPRAGSERHVIVIPHPVNANHNGGQMQFLGNLLYFGTGDGGSGGDPPNNAQNKDVLLGKLLRIDPRPSGGAALLGAGRATPSSASPAATRSTATACATRSASPSTRSAPTQPRIAIGDVGQNRFEELDYTTVAAASGANFGWDALEGFAPYEEENSGTPDPGGTTKPIFAYPHSRARQLLDHRRLRRRRPPPALSI